MLRSLKRHTPLQRLGTEAEVSAAIVFLLSPAAAFISGETLRVDGAAPNAKRHHELPPHDRSSIFEGFHRAVPPKALQEE
jgi:citronellol/citronellal dehydrogenase